MGPREPMWAAETELVQRLEAEWKVIAGSRWLRDRLQAWAVEDDRLAFDDGEELVAAAQRRDASSWGERDQVLTALLERADGEHPKAIQTRLGHGSISVTMDRYGHLMDGLDDQIAVHLDARAEAAAPPAPPELSPSDAPAPLRTRRNPR